MLRHFDAILDAVLMQPQGQNASHASTAAGGFLSLPRAILASLLTHDALCVASEEKILKGVLRWGLANLPSTAKSYSHASSGGDSMGDSLNSSRSSNGIGILSPSGYAHASSHMSAGSLSIANSANSGNQQLGSGPASLPLIPVTAVPGLRALLADVLPAVRFAHMDVAILKAPVVSAVVENELVLQAMFEKVQIEREREIASMQAAMLAQQYPVLAAALAQGMPAYMLGNGGNTGGIGGYPGGFGDNASLSSMMQGFMGGGIGGYDGAGSMAGHDSFNGSNTGRHIYLPANERPTMDQPRILSSVSSYLDSPLLSSAAASGSGNGALSARRADAASSYLGSGNQNVGAQNGAANNNPLFLSSLASRYSTNAGANASNALLQQSVASARLNGIAAAAHTSRSVYNDVTGSVDVDLAAQLAAEASSHHQMLGGYGGHPTQMQQGAHVPGRTPMRRYGDITVRRPATAMATPVVMAGGRAINAAVATPSVSASMRFDAFLAGSVALANAGRTVSFLDIPEMGGGIHGMIPIGGAKKSQKQQRRSRYAAEADDDKASGADGSAGAVLVSATPCLGISTASSGNSMLDAFAATSGNSSSVSGSVTATGEAMLPPGCYNFDFVVEDSTELLDRDPEEWSIPGQNDLSAGNLHGSAVNVPGLGIVPSSMLQQSSAPVGMGSTMLAFNPPPATPSGLPTFGSLLGRAPASSTPAAGFSSSAVVSSAATGAAQSAAVTSSSFAPFEVAICILPAGAAISALSAGLRSSDPSLYGAYFVATNRGDVYIASSSFSASASSIGANYGSSDANASATAPVSAEPPSTPRQPGAADGSQTPVKPGSIPASNSNSSNAAAGGAAKGKKPPTPTQPGSTATAALLPATPSAAQSRSQVPSSSVSAVGEVSPRSEIGAVSDSNMGHLAGGNGAMKAALQVGPLQRVAVGCPFGVSSYVSLSIDSSTGDIGIAISSARCNFDEDAEEDFGDASAGSGAADAGSGASFNFMGGSGSSSGGAGSSSGAAGGQQSMSAPRPPPHPFSLLPRTSNVPTAAADAISEHPYGSQSAPSSSAAVQTLHCPDPSLGPKAQIHAVCARLPLSALSNGVQALQIAVLARVPNGLVMTMVPPLQ